MGELETYFLNNPGKRIHKWRHFFEIYEQHFGRFKGKDVHLLEIGIDSGGSLEMWQAYFGPQAKVYGSDINPACKELEKDGFRIFIGDQNDRHFLSKLKVEIPKLD